MIAIARIILGLVFIVAGAMKVWDPAAFQVAIDSFRLLPAAGSAAASIYLPWLEIISGLALALGRWGWQAGLHLIVGMLVIFVAAVLLAMARGLNPDCGCFGAIGGSTAATLVRDLVLLALAAFIWFRSRRPVATASTGSPPCHAEYAT